MPKLPRPTGKEMLAFLESRGFTLVRVHGSHHILRNGHVRTSVPIHGNNQLKIGTLHGILRDIRLSAEEFADTWGS